MKLLDFLEADKKCWGHCTLHPEGYVVIDGPHDREECWWYKTYPEEFAFAEKQGWINAVGLANPFCRARSEKGAQMHRQLKGDFT